MGNVEVEPLVGRKGPDPKIEAVGKCRKSEDSGATEDRFFGEDEIVEGCAAGRGGKEIGDDGHEEGEPD